MRKVLLISILILAGAQALAGEVDPSVYKPNSPKLLPKAYKLWGPKAFGKINELRKGAALKAAKSSECNRVETSELSSNRSEHPNLIVIFVDCENGKRFYMTQADIEGDDSSSSVEKKTSAFTTGAMYERCRREIKSRLTFPSSFSEGGGPSTEYRAPQGNVVIDISFTARNRLGGDLPQRGKCFFDDRGFTAAEIYDR